MTRRARSTRINQSNTTTWQLDNNLLTNPLRNSLLEDLFDNLDISFHSLWNRHIHDRSTICESLTQSMLQNFNYHVHKKFCEQVTNTCPSTNTRSVAQQTHPFIATKPCSHSELSMQNQFFIADGAGAVTFFVMLSTSLGICSCRLTK